MILGYQRSVNPRRRNRNQRYLDLKRTVGINKNVLLYLRISPPFSSSSFHPYRKSIARMMIRKDSQSVNCFTRPSNYSH